MTSKLYRNFITHCNVEMGIILRCIARKFSPKDLVGESGRSVVCFWHNGFAFRGIAYQYLDTKGYCLEGVMVSKRYTFYACRFSMDLEALEWPEFWMSQDPNEQVISFEDGLIGLINHSRAEEIIRKACPEITESHRVADIIIEPMVHSDDDKIFVTEDDTVRGKVNVQVFEANATQFMRMCEILYKLAHWFGF